MYSVDTLIFMYDSISENYTSAMGIEACVCVVKMLMRVCVCVCGCVVKMLVCVCVCVCS